MKHLSLISAFLVLCTMATAAPSGIFNVRSYGAKGDGRNIDSEAINKAIDAASKAGGGTVFLPTGTYLSYSIRLKDHINLHFGPGAVLKAAEPTADMPRCFSGCS